VSGVKYKAEDGTERIALAHLSIICDGMYSSLRKSLADHQVQGPTRPLRPHFMWFPVLELS